MVGQVIETKTLDLTVLRNLYMNKKSVDKQVDTILANNPVYSTDNFNNWLIKAVTVIDLTTLSGDDTASNVTRLCAKEEEVLSVEDMSNQNPVLADAVEVVSRCITALSELGFRFAANPLAPQVVKKLGLPEGKVKTAAVCVYPNRVADANNVIKRLELQNEIQIASVATGFPSGLYPLESRLLEISQAIKDGANEIDVVLDRSLVLTGQWETVFNEVRRMREVCGKEAHLKVILGVGELGTYENVYKASMVSMLAGADFIKTSTGKEAVNATLPIGLIMCRAIRDFYQMTGVKVGLKPAGGIKTPRDAVNWLVLVHNELGPDWLSPSLFRIGASSLLDVIEKHLDQNTCSKV